MGVGVGVGVGVGAGEGGGWWFGRGGGPKVGGPARNPLLPHAYLQKGCVAGGLGAWRYVCDNSAFSSLPGYILLIWRSKHGWFDEREACTKKIERCWRHGPQPTTSQNPGGGGLRGVADKDWARPLPPPGGADVGVTVRVETGVGVGVGIIGRGWDGCTDYHGGGPWQMNCCKGH